MAIKVLTFLYYCPFWMLVLLVLSIILTMRYFRRVLIKLSNVVQLAICVLFIFLVLVGILWITILSRNYYSSHIANCIPFSFILFARDNPRIIRAALLNIVLYIPMGFGVSFMIRDNSKQKAIAIITAFVVSLTIEVIQYFCMLGSAELDDLMLNTFGAFIGYMLSAESIMKKK